MARKLSSLLINDSVVSIEQMEDALQRQVVFGGRLGTILLEMGLIAESELVHYLALAHGIMPASERTCLNLDPDALQLLPLDEIQDLGFLPVRLYPDGTADALVLGPIEPEKLGEMREQTGFDFVLHITPEFRFRQALRRYFEVRVPQRLVRMLERHPVEFALGEASNLGDLMKEADDGTRMGVGWTIDAVGTHLVNCNDRDEIIRVLLGFAGSFASRRMLFVCRRDVLRGHAAAGSGIIAARIRQVRAPIPPGSAMARVCSGDTYYQGPPNEGGLGSLYAAVNIRPPVNCVLLPIVVGHRTASVLLMDHGATILDPVTLEPLFEAIEHTSAALERLIQLRKSGTSHPAVTEATSHVQGETAPSEAPTEPTTEDLPTIDISVAEEPITSPRDESTTDEAKRFEDAGLDDLLADGWDLPDIFTRSHPPSPEAPVDADLHLPSRPENREDGDAASKGEALDLSRLAAAIQNAPDSPLDGEADPRPGDNLSTPPGHDGALLDHSSVQLETVPTSNLAPEVEAALADFQTAVHQLSSADPDDRLAARKIILEAGDRALPALLASFPGPLFIDRYGFSPSQLPPMESHGPVLRTLVEMGNLAAPAMANLLDLPGADARYYATLFFGRVRYDPALLRIAERLFDKDQSIREAARFILRSLRTTVAAEKVNHFVRQALRSGDSFRQQEAAQAAGAFGDRGSIPHLIECLSSTNRRLAELAHRNLVLVTFTDLGPLQKKWARWWERHSTEDRYTWLLGGMGHSQREIRQLAADELALFPSLVVNYHADSSRGDRRRAKKVVAQFLRDSA